MRSLLLFGVLWVGLLTGCEYRPILQNASWQTTGQYVVSFTCDGCRQCQLDKPKLRQLQAQGIGIIEVNRIEQPELVKAYSIDRYPTYLVLDDGMIQSRSASLTVIISRLKALGWLLPANF